MDDAEPAPHMALTNRSARNPRTSPPTTSPPETPDDVRLDDESSILVFMQNTRRSFQCSGAHHLWPFRSQISYARNQATARLRTTIAVHLMSVARGSGNRQSEPSTRR